MITNKVLFYFTADGRIDFRQLVGILHLFLRQGELRQIGVRDETKFLEESVSAADVSAVILYLSEFAPVSIRMAKEQNLSLNQTKI